jgi:hypothetical protein
LEFVLVVRNASRVLLNASSTSAAAAGLDHVAGPGVELFVERIGL